VSARRRLVALALPLAILFVVLAVLALEGTLRPGEVREWADREIREPVDDLGAAGPLLFIVVIGAATVLLFPGPVAAAISGLLFGTAVGFPTTLAAWLLGGTLAFSIARWWAHDAVAELASRRPRLLALRELIGRRGFLAVLYSRITPGVPYNLVNYVAGLAPIRLVAFAGATAIGAAPRAFAYTALGGTLGDLRSPEALIAVGVLVCVGILGVTLGLRAAGSAGARSYLADRWAGRR
jgi:uncharacterized membrane protein YdjX (TVP38/TMEM64 family)